MSLNLQPTSEQEFFNLRREGKIYISKAFKLSSNSTETRNVKIVFDNSTTVILGELNGILTLRQSSKKKQQICVLINQDDRKIKRLTLQRFELKKSGDFSTTDEHSFTFRADEFQHLIHFLKSIKFIDFSNTEKFQIEDLSSNQGNKALIDISEKELVYALKQLNGQDRVELLQQIKRNITKKDIDILLGRKEALETFKLHLENEDWDEKDWQYFFQEQKWIFGCGLDYRIMSEFDREMNVSAVGTDNKEKVIVDFLMTFTDFTVTVEIKKPQTSIFDKSKNRSGSWSLHSEFIDAVTQVLEQKAEWNILGQSANNYNRTGDKKLAQRTRDSKAILIAGNKNEYLSLANIREKEIKQDTLELFRRGLSNIEIITFDELYERADFIVNQD